MSRVLLLFPNQLFPKNFLQPWLKTNNITEIIVVEDPVFYGDREAMWLRLNKLRLAYQYVVVRQYIEQHESSKIITHWSYELMKKDGRRMYQHLVMKDRIYIFDPMDHLLMSKVKGIIPEGKLQIMDSPMFLMTKTDIDAFWSSKPIRRSVQHSEFLNFVKKRLHLLEKEKSHDTENRNPYPSGAEEGLPALPWKNKNGVPDRLWKDAEVWVERNFPKNPGRINHSVLPFVATNYIEVKAWLQRFLRERFDKFGMYQDAIVKGNHWMYHSGIAMYINFGLITAKEVVDVVQFYFEKMPPLHRKKQMASYEGFMRQLIGWREYARLYYVKVPATIWKRNVFKMRKTKELSSVWYEGKTGVPIVDETIRDAFEMGYLHHIRRLMVMSNYMTLSNVHPDHVYQWMYEFSMDSWDWVMIFNVYSMGTWSDGGFAMRKPYISSVAYIKRMAREKTGAWETLWQSKWLAFLKQHKDILLRTQLASIVRANAIR